MKAKYTANTQVCLSLVLGNGQSIHVAFTPLTGGKSVYYTEDERIQRALESHYRYGRLFKKEEAPAPVATVTKKKATTEKKEDAVKEIVMSDYGDARNYLADKFNVSRTKIRSKAQIIDVAAAHNIVFKIKE